MAHENDRRRLLAGPAIVGVVIAAICIVFVGRALTSQWAEVKEEVADAELGWLVVGLAAAAAAMCWIAWCWEDALGALGQRPGRRRTVAWYFTGEIGKYVPGTVWPVLGRGELARRGGVPAGRAYPSVVLSLVALYTAAAAVAAVLVALVALDHGTHASSLSALLLLVLPAGLVALHPRPLGAVRDVLIRMAGRNIGIALPTWRASVQLVVRYSVAWLLIWAATWCVARSLVPEPSALRIGVATTLSWIAGFVAVPVPAGAGVREAVFVASAGLAGGVGASIAIATRLLFVLVDIAGAVLSSPWHRRRRLVPERMPEPTPEPEPAA